MVLFGLPGAFTPTCHKNHLPGFIAAGAAFRAKGVDKIAMTAVNDHYVLKAWAAGRRERLAMSTSSPTAAGISPRRSASTSTFPPAAFRAALKALFDAGRRRGGEELNIEPETGKADVSGAEHILAQIK